MGKKASIDSRTQFFIDILSFVFSIIPGILAWFTLYAFFVYSHLPIYSKLLLAIFVLVFSFILIIAFLRLCIPRLKAGHYKVGLNKMTLAWFMHLALGRAIYVARLDDLIKCMHVFKFLYFRALGANIPFQLTSSLKFDIVDASLVTIGKHSVIGDSTDISCHMFRGNLLYLAPNIIGEQVQISAECMIGPGNTIGDHCKLGYGTKLLNRTLAPYTKIKTHESD